MKVIQPPLNPVFKSEHVTQQRKKFQLETSAKTFKLISSTIYKYKIRAIVRELSCNAIDGHIVNGNMGSFDVHLPTQLDPHFTIRDYGVGMSQEMVEDVFSVYFKSTKNDSDLLIGSMGLGSKSPLCYVEAFSVISVHGGVKSAYSVYLEAGEPYCQLLYSTPSEEHTGVTVSIPVMVEDVKEWEEEANRVYESFGEIRPNFIGAVKPKINYIKKSDKLDYSVHQSKYLAVGIYARMGNILYPLDDNMYNKSLFWSYSKQKTSYIFDFEIGTLDYMPSREQLSLDKNTKKLIIDRMSKINGTFKTRLLESFSKCKTVRDKIRFYLTLPTSVQNHIAIYPELMVNGKSLPEIVARMKNGDSYKGIALSGYWANSSTSASCDFQTTSSYRYSSYRNETLKRQDIVNRLIDPTNVDKLILIKMDVSVPRPVLCGYSMLNGRGYTPFVCYSEHSSAATKNTVAMLIEYGAFEESEILHLTASEMTAEVEAYKTENQRQKQESNAGRSRRTATPTAYEYRMDEEGNVEMTTLSLNKTSFLEYGEVPVIRLYGIDDYKGVREESSIDMSTMTKHYMKEIMSFCDLPVIMVVRSSLWGYIDETKHYDVEEILCDWYNETGKTIKQENHRDIAWCNKSSRLRAMIEYLDIDTSRLVKYVESPEKQFMDDITRNLKVSGSHTVNRGLNKAYKQHQSRKKESIRRYDELYNKLTELNPMLEAIISVLVDSYRGSSIHKTMTKPEVVEQLKKSLKWK